ncbi:hypothetical protein ACIRBX_06130 [Kitasatospora sp. NPDC096147]|uniref:hypothetical protein n=1 Tax=Kitasatospora sp. NPDC096147 TaxID=3364093 RepID=UPI003821EA89
MRIARPLAVTAAALTFAVGVPLATGSSAAWAVCSAANPLPSTAPAPRHQGTLEVKALTAPPTRITAGGAQVEVPIRITNRTDAPYRQVEPLFSIGHFYDMKADLAAEQVKVEWRQGRGSWKKLGLQPGCTRGLVNQDTLPRLALKQGESAELSFRFALVGGVPKALDTVMYSVSAQGEDLVGGGTQGTLKVAPAAPKPATTKAPTTKPATTKATAPGTTAPTTKGTAPAPGTTAPTTKGTAPAPSGTATPVQQDVAATELASTGPSTPTTFVFLSALGVIALGGAVLTAVRWSRSHR